MECSAKNDTSKVIYIWNLDIHRLGKLDLEKSLKTGARSKKLNFRNKSWHIPIR